MKYYEIQDLLDLLDRSGKPHDKNSIINAYDLANAAHKGQCRVSGEPYISHPIAVAMILADLGMDDECIQAALLHDVLEDTPVKAQALYERFGRKVLRLVVGESENKKTES